MGGMEWEVGGVECEVGGVEWEVGGVEGVEYESVEVHSGGGGWLG